MFRGVSATTADWFESNPARLRGIVPTDYSALYHNYSPRFAPRREEIRKQHNLGKGSDY